MTLSMQTFDASKAESVPDFRVASSSASTWSSDVPYSSAMPSNAGSSYPLETEIRTLWRIYQESGLSARLMRVRSISTSSTAVPPDVPASAGILLVRDVGIEIAGALNPDLHDALRDLEGTVGEAREEGFPTPSDMALEYARRILCSVYELSPRRYEIYPTPDGEVAIDAPGGFGRSVLVLCGSDGGALCLVNMSGSHRRARYSDAKTLPDGFVREALVELDRGSYPAA